MSTRILIDGYNLLFASHLAGKSRGPGWLEQARERLIRFVSQHLSEAERAETVLVFDASHSGSRSRADTEKNGRLQGIEVLFATEHDEADDLLEVLIAKHSSPKTLTVVSSDHRIQKRALAKRATTLDSEVFLQQLETQSNEEPPAAKAPSPKHATLSDEEVTSWMREFELEKRKLE